MVQCVGVLWRPWWAGVCGGGVDERATSVGWWCRAKDDGGPRDW